MTKRKETQPANSEVEREMEKLLLGVLRDANAADKPLDIRLEALNIAGKVYATLRKLPPSGDERKGGFNVLREQANGGGAGGSRGLGYRGAGTDTSI